MRRRASRIFRPSLSTATLERRELLAAWVAIIDSGIDPSNDATSIRIRGDCDFSVAYNAVTQTTQAQGGDVYDVINENGVNNGYGRHHGTVVADLASQAIDSATAQPGAGATIGNVKIMPIRATDSNGYFIPSAAVEGIYWAVNHGASAINLSWTVSGAQQISGNQYPHNGNTLTDAIRYAATHNVVFFAPAGNNSSNVDLYPSQGISPAKLPEPNILVSAAVYGSGNLTGQSNWGANYADVGSLTDSGGLTSFASGYSAGLGAAVAAILPATHSYSDVINIIKSTVTVRSQAPAGASPWCTSGGNVNIASAMASAVASSPTVAPPTVSSPTSPGAGRVTLSWTQVAGAASYTIQRSDNGGAYAVVGNTTVNTANPGYATSLTDAGLSGGSYAYQVKATVNGVDSGWSAAASLSGVSPAPASLFATGFSGASGGLPAPWVLDGTTGGIWGQANGVAMQSDSTTAADPKKVSPYLSSLVRDGDTQILAKVRIDQAVYGQFFRVGVGLNTNSTNGRGYNLAFTYDNGVKSLQFINDGYALSAATAFAYADKTWYWFSMVNQGGWLYGKVWQDGSAEPSTWTITQQLTGGFIPGGLLPAGYPALNGGSVSSTSPGSVAASYDNLIVSAVTATTGGATVTATPGTPAGQVDLSWTSVPNATGYRIDRQSGGSWTRVGNTTVNPGNEPFARVFQDTGLAAGTYTYRVSAIVGGAEVVSVNMPAVMATAALPGQTLAAFDGGTGGGLPYPWYTNGNNSAWSYGDGVSAQTNTAAGDPKKLMQITPATLGNENFQVVAKVRIDSSVAGPMTRVGVGLNTEQYTGNGYNLIFRNDGTKQVAILNDGIAFGNSTPFAYAENTWYWFKFLNQDGMLHGKVWRDGTAEPTAWTVEQPLSGTFIGAGLRPQGYASLNGGSESSSYAGSLTASFDAMTVQNLYDWSSNAGGTVTARGGGAGQGPGNLFDDNVGSSWLDYSSSSWVQYEFAGGASHVVTQYSLTSAADTATYPGRAPASWKFWGFDGVNWVLLDTQVNQADTLNNHTQTYAINNTVAYKAYRLTDIVSTDTTIIQLADIKLLGT